MPVGILTNREQDCSYRIIKKDFKISILQSLVLERIQNAKPCLLLRVVISQKMQISVHNIVTEITVLPMDRKFKASKVGRSNESSVAIVWCSPVQIFH